VLIGPRELGIGEPGSETGELVFEAEDVRVYEVAR